MFVLLATIPKEKEKPQLRIDAIQKGEEEEEEEEEELPTTPTSSSSASSTSTSTSASISASSSTSISTSASTSSPASTSFSSSASNLLVGPRKAHGPSGRKAPTKNPLRAVCRIYNLLNSLHCCMKGWALISLFHSLLSAKMWAVNQWLQKQQQQAMKMNLSLVNDPQEA